MYNEGVGGKNYLCSSSCNNVELLPWISTIF
jgi:hypothetical protein